MYYFFIITWLRYWLLVYRVKGIDLRVGRCFRGYKDWKVYVYGVWRLIGKDTFVGL